ncbi:3-phosphoshikimate 1-carboxyvinyltransferase [Tessaracoccus caeni]|uniref:3-phosphoshikimate 1-carboxyvinyltransferase n=1 Tax=Tessaracoccus caeni TaxID=3031239 RepID=UPI0023DCE991|nr:3-phosphoshikimate 1-carboxyvinyltransferase [Tessaracoccus caeni]MDF1490146.1 3-phosphoshikimate 1-carboxyvinyltransferase [Tessaracoccus caeni]
MSPGPVIGSVAVPGSKSETNRALVLAALADGPSQIVGALDSRDSRLMVDALRQLGVEIVDDGDALSVRPPSQFRGGARVDCGLAGTVMRFLPPVALLADGPTEFFGDAHASQRPMAPIIDALCQVGAECTADRLPFTMTPGPELGDVAAIDASASSQFISGPLLAACRLPRGLRLSHTGDSLPSLPHIAMTVEMLRDRGVEISQPSEREWHVAPGPIAARDCRVEPDLTNASVFLAAAALTGGSVGVPGWPDRTVQPGALFLDIVERFGARVTRNNGSVTVTGNGRLTAIDVDLHAASELTPVIAALGAFADGRTVISGVAHIRGHETDRLAALVTELRRVGVAADETADGLWIEGCAPAELRGALLETYADHRMVHFAALLALLVPGISVTDLGCVSKTMPDFEAVWRGLIG